MEKTNPKYYIYLFKKYICNLNIKLVNLINLINLDKPNAKYLAPISLILLFKIFYNYKNKLVNLINLDKANPKYLAPISPISFS